MTTLLPTLFLAFGIVLVALTLLGISKLLTGRSRLQPGACGRAPHRDDDCGKKSSCSLCKKE